MEIIIKVNLKMVKQMEKAYIHLKMEVYTQDLLLMVILMVLEHFNILMGINTQDNGKIISKMVKDSIILMINLYMMDFSR